MLNFIKRFSGFFRSEELPNPQDLFKRGDEVSGKIIGRQKYGFFVSIGEGVIGLVYRDEIAWKGDETTYRVGDIVTVQVLGENADKGLALSIKRANINGRYENFVKSSPIGSVISGKVKTVLDYGIFVTVSPGVDGLLHKSAMPSRAHPYSYKRNEPITVVVSSFTQNPPKIGLEIKPQ